MKDPPPHPITPFTAHAKSKLPIFVTVVFLLGHFFIIFLLNEMHIIITFN